MQGEQQALSIPAASSFWNQPVPIGAVPQSTGSVTWYSGNLPCLLGGDHPDTRLPSPLGTT